jgi:hypothetical protein
VVDGVSLLPECLRGHLSLLLLGAQLTTNLDALQDGLTVLIKLELGDDDLRGVDAQRNALAGGLVACDTLDVNHILETVDGGDLALTALVAATDNGDLVVLADGDAADLWSWARSVSCRRFDSIASRCVPGCVGMYVAYVVLLTQLLAQRGAHDVAANAGGGVEVSLSRLASGGGDTWETEHVSEGGQKKTGNSRGEHGGRTGGSVLRHFCWWGLVESWMVDEEGRNWQHSRKEKREISRWGRGSRAIGKNWQSVWEPKFGGVRKSRQQALGLAKYKVADGQRGCGCGVLVCGLCSQLPVYRLPALSTSEPQGFEMHALALASSP